MTPISARDALLIIDIQNDFLPGGALAVPEGDAIIPVVNQLMQRGFGAIAASCDWHPAEHCSFTSFTPPGPWPAHCVAGTRGAALASALDQGTIGIVISKGRDRGCDSYSAFLDNDQITRTGLDSWLRGMGIERVFVTGLALDYCVTFTALDAVAAGFECVVLEDACRAIAPGPHIAERLAQSGVAFVTTAMLA